MLCLVHPVVCPYDASYSKTLMHNNLVFAFVTGEWTHKIRIKKLNMLKIEGTCTTHVEKIEKIKMDALEPVPSMHL